MKKDIDPKVKLISDYLKVADGELFVIPEYQRAYSWDVEKCDKLWQDIEAFEDIEAATRKAAKRISDFIFSED